jgi:hypothetical protein
VGTALCGLDVTAKPDFGLFVLNIGISTTLAVLFRGRIHWRTGRIGNVAANKFIPRYIAQFGNPSGLAHSIQKHFSAKR